MPSKYRNIRTMVNGRTFDSKKEAHRWLQLSTLQKHGKINSLQLQPKFEIEINGFHVCRYVADFSYREGEDETVIVEDVKSVITKKNPTYRLKKKLMRAIYQIEIREF